MIHLGYDPRAPRHRRMFLSSAASSGTNRSGPVARRLRIQAARLAAYSNFLMELGRAWPAGFPALSSTGTQVTLLHRFNGKSRFMSLIATATPHGVELTAVTELRRENV